MMPSLSSFLLTSWASLATLVAIWCLLRVRKLLGGASVRSLTQLSAEVAELQSSLESLSAGHRKLAARVGMREVRQRREEQADAEPEGDIGEKIMPKSKLREIARARGFKIT